MQLRIDFYQLVNQVADGFEKDKDVQVTYDGRQALIEPALPHQEDVQRALDQNKITITFLQDSVRQVLNNARKFVTDRKIIDRRGVVESMKHYCPYLFWC